MWPERVSNPGLLACLPYLISLISLEAFRILQELFIYKYRYLPINNFLRTIQDLYTHTHQVWREPVEIFTQVPYRKPRADGRTHGQQRIKHNIPQLFGDINSIKLSQSAKLEQPKCNIMISNHTHEFPLTEL